MITQDDAAATHANSTCIGPLAPHIDEFEAHLIRAGYAPATVQRKRELIWHLSRWLKRRKMPLVRLDEEQLRQISFHRHFGKRHGDMWTVHQLLLYLRNIGCLAPPRKRIDRTALGHLIRDFEEFLRSERGLSRVTVVNYVSVTRRFLIEHFRNKPLRLKTLRPRDIHRYIINRVQSTNHGLAAKPIISALRSFLRFLHQRGAIGIDLAAAVPAVANWRLSYLPKSLPPKQVKQLLASCDRNTPTGQRDYAILLLMARLGLRAGEVVGMTLDDLDWEHGEIVVHGKGQQEGRLPLPTDVGEALAIYLRHVRPAVPTRRFFIRIRAPRQGLANNRAICSLVRRALKRAGLKLEFKGSHLLRHSLASNLLHRGASLSEIGQLLRHSELATTQIYAKVDIAALRAIALPWPRGAL